MGPGRESGRGVGSINSRDITVSRDTVASGFSRSILSGYEDMFEVIPEEGNWGEEADLNCPQPSALLLAFPPAFCGGEV